MNTFLNGLKEDYNYGLTENGAVTHISTLNPVLDMFALGGSYRNRSEEDCILLFKNAYEADAELALKCLFYLGDIRGGQGERRFFRVCYKWLCEEYPVVARENLELIPYYKRWDDVLYSTIGTSLFNNALAFCAAQLILDETCVIPSLCAKWMPSENCSSKESKAIANALRNRLDMSHKEYRQMLSKLRAGINIVERKMSAGKWNEIQYDKLPSKAGLIYKNAFAKHDYERYNAFANSKETKVNAATLNPVDIAHRALFHLGMDKTDRAMLDKYWQNLKDYYNGREENGLCVVDVSGSMTGIPMEAAVSIGAYIAERGHGPFANHFITFSEQPKLVKFEGIDIVDKFNRCRCADWGQNTNIEAVFNLLLNNLKKGSVNPQDCPTRLYILSDMEFDRGLNLWRGSGNPEKHLNTLLENIALKWKEAGYELPQLVFWNLDARSNNIPAIGGRFSYVSGFSMSILEGVLSGKTGIDLMLEVLNSKRYSKITIS